MTSPPTTIDQLRVHVEHLAIALGFTVVDIATDLEWTTFYVTGDKVGGRLMMKNAIINGWSSIHDAKVGLGLGRVTRLGERSVFEVTP